MRHFLNNNHASSSFINNLTEPKQAYFKQRNLIVTLLLQNTNAGVTKRDTAASGPVATPDVSHIFTEGPFADLLKKAQDGVATLQSRFLEIAGVENKEQLLDVVNTKAKSYATIVDGLLKTIEEELGKQSGVIDESVTKLTTRLQTTVNQLQEQNPELLKATQEYKVQNFPYNFYKVL